MGEGSLPHIWWLRNFSLLNLCQCGIPQVLSIITPIQYIYKCGSILLTNHNHIIIPDPTYNDDIS